MQKSNSNKTIIFALLGCGGLLAIPLLAFVGLIGWFAMQPEGGVKLAHEMDPYATEYLQKHNILEADEQLIAYYDATISMDGTEAAILTNRRLIHHIGGKTASVLLEKVEDIRHRTEGLQGDIIEAEESSGTILRVEIAPLNQGETFKNALMSAWKKAIKKTNDG